MPEPSVPVDGVTTAAAPVVPPSSPPKDPAILRWKRILLFVGGSAYIFYLLWCLILMMILPAPKGGMQGLAYVGLATSLIAIVVFAAIGATIAMHVLKTTVSQANKKRAIILLPVVVAPGIIISLLTPFLITREPPITIDIVTPAASKDWIAPVTMTFSVEESLPVLEQNGFRPIKYRWDVNNDKKFDQETVKPAVTAIFDREGVYNVGLSMVSSDGATRSISRRFIIQQAVLSLTPSVPIVEKPVVISLAHLIKAEDIVEVQWDFDGDGKTDLTSKTPTATNTFYATGEVTVSAQVVLKNKTQASYQRTFEVIDPPELPFDVRLATEPTRLISPAPFAVRFRVITKEPVSRIQWDFGDGSVEEGQQVVHTFTRNGTYAITAKVRSQSGVTATLSSVVQIVDPLVLSDLTFEGKPELRGDFVEGEVPLTIDYKPKTSTPFIQFFWEAPDATEVGSTEEHLQAIYRREGTYELTLIAQDQENHVLRKKITVDVQPPSALLNFLMEPEGGVAPLTVKFDASAIDIPNETITGFIWKFGDDSEGEFGAASTQHTYFEPGTYHVDMTVRTTSGKLYVADKTLVVREGQRRSCIILPSRTQGSAPLSISFTAQCSSQDIERFEWDFGDGFTNDSEENDITHSFLEPGTFSVSLTVHEKSGAKKSDIKPLSITVFP